jgi:hypothetical protein
MYQNVASGMALAHSMFLRYLNSVYLQAPHVKAADEAAFLQWALMWVKAIEEHHHNEEIMFFPAVEKMTGQAGVMDVNIEQHHAFVPGIEALRAYCDGCVAGTLQFAGARVVELIDAFGHVLRQHLFEEIDTLLGLERFGDDKMAGLQAAIDADAKASMVSMTSRPWRRLKPPFSHAMPQQSRNYRTAQTVPARLVLRLARLRPLRRRGVRRGQLETLAARAAGPLLGLPEPHRLLHRVSGQVCALRQGRTPAAAVWPAERGLRLCWVVRCRCALL